jgi:hypothetical protein
MFVPLSVNDLLKYMKKDESSKNHNRITVSLCCSYSDVNAKRYKTVKFYVGENANKTLETLINW